ncbi:hypothetical protein A3Q56_05768 [Intoshia linei]|uniref:Uncharacterized protein n=1 Tax=Intoshia linei TaxID=1819745 RepID=A0A177AWZ2_9BILA|nr:hypothetical protein A3Q56_05768 [Intoshia linei]
MQVINDFSYRQDGRKADEFRQIDAKIGTLSQPDGSATWSQGNCKLLVAVYGPRECRSNRGSYKDKASVKCEYRRPVSVFSEKKKRNRSDRMSNDNELYIKHLFESVLLTNLYPASQIEIIVEVMQSDGSELTMAINAICLALIDATIPMKDVVSAVTVGYANNELFVNPTQTELYASDMILEFAMLITSETVMHLHMTGTTDCSKLQNIMNYASKKCLEMYEKVGNVARNYTQRCISLKNFADEETAEKSLIE